MDGWMDKKKEKKRWMVGWIKKYMKKIWMVGWIKKMKKNGDGWLDGQKKYEKIDGWWMDRKI